MLLLVVMVGVPAFLMFKGISQFGSAKEELNRSVTQLRSFYKKNPFPKKENIDKENKNLDEMQKWFGKLVDVVTAGQVEQVEATPTRFTTKYNDMRNRVLALANPVRGAKMLDKDNALGFSKYAEGALPVAVDVPRLMQQMMITERLATVLIESKVKKINKIMREEFDSVSSMGASPQKAVSSSRRSSRRRGGASVSKKSTNSIKTHRKTDIYEVQSFSLEFSAKEYIALDVLNRFSRDDLFVVITGVEFIKAAKDLKMPGSDDDKVSKNDETDAVVVEKINSEPPIRQQRRVSGPAFDMPMTVRVDLDVYTFFVHKVKALKTASD